jgi:DNA-binding NarL/FixJ family response regulator
VLIDDPQCSVEAGDLTGKALGNMDSFNSNSESARLRVLVIDDQISVREMLAIVLEREVEFSVGGAAASGFEGLRLFRKLRPALVVAALALPEMNGAEMIAAMREEQPKVRIMIYSGSRNRELIDAGLAAGAHGFVHKTEPLETLRAGFLAVARGSSFFGPFATRALDELRASRRVAGGLTSRQRLVLQMVAEGLSTKQVAGRLSLAPKTVEHYRTQLMQKLGLRDVASLTRYAVRCGLVEAE